MKVIYLLTKKRKSGIIMMHEKEASAFHMLRHLFVGPLFLRRTSTSLAGQGVCELRRIRFAWQSEFDASF